MINDLKMLPGSDRHVDLIVLVHPMHPQCQTEKQRRNEREIDS